MNQQNETLRTIRKQHGYSQESVAQALNIHASTLSKYESGDRKVPTHTLKALSEFYGVSVDMLLGAGDDNSASVMLKKPYQAPRKPINLVLILVFFLPAIAFLFIDALLLMVISLSALIANFVWHGYHFFVHEPAQRTYFTVKAGRSVEYVHQAGEASVKPLKRQGIINLLFGFLAFLMAYSFINVAHEGVMSTLEQMIFNLLLVGNFLLIFHILFALITNNIFTSIIKNREANARLNTYKFTALKILALIGYYVLMLWLGDLIHEGAIASMSDGIMIGLIVHFYIFFLYAFAHRAIEFHRFFTVTLKKTTQETTNQ